jgi:hypothetical protein
MDRTIVYYTGHLEDPIFEEKIVQALKDVAGDIPIISVSQKPMDLGTNICVGEVGLSDFNATRQLQIGAIEAKTKWIIWAESDCLYSPDYFQFTPEREDASYRSNNVWIVSWNLKEAYFKSSSECAQIMGRDYLISQIDKYFEGYGYWNEQDWTLRKAIVDNTSHQHFHTQPIINFKTGRGMRKRTKVHKRVKPLHYLDYWGSIEELGEKYGVFR